MLMSMSEVLQIIPWLQVSVSIFIIYVIHWFFTPKNIIKDLSEVGYSHLMKENKIKLTRKTKVEVAEDCRRKRIVGSLPPVYPNGWYAIFDSGDITKKEVKQVYVLGQHLAVFRGESGQIHIVSALCPHLGANLAVGGQIQGDCIRCPFHGWKFSGISGNCVEIPYSSTIPDDSRIKSWPSYEINSFIWVWYHAENESPRWHLPTVSPVQDGKWWYRGRTEHYVNSHIQEIPENGADITHLPILHEPVAFAGNDLFLMHKWWAAIIAKHKWKEASWTAKTEPGQRHIGTMNLVSETLCFDRFVAFRLNCITEQIGPGFVIINMETSMGPMIILQTVTPVEPMLQKVVHKMFYPLRMSLFGTITFYSESILFERDVIVWNHKKYLAKPLLTKEEGTIARHRRWFSQFYSENSPTYEHNSLDW